MNEQDKKVKFTSADVNEISRHWRKSWSDRSRSELVTKHGPGFFLWRAVADGLGSSGMFHARGMIDNVLAGSSMEDELRKLIDETNHEAAVIVVMAFEKEGKALAITVEKLAPPRRQAWFEMREVRARSLATAVWIPLRASHEVLSQGKYGYEGYSEEFYGIGSVMFDAASNNTAIQLGWSDIGIVNSYSGGSITKHLRPGDQFSVKELITFRVPFRKMRFRGQLEIPSIEQKEIQSFLWAGNYQDYRSGTVGTGLVIAQTFSAKERAEWNLHQDFVVALRLMREADVWVRPEEGYKEVARLRRDDSGEPILLEVRAEHLRDYLKAKSMNLYVSSYRSRKEICDSASHITWESIERDESVELQRWEGRKTEIHEGGGVFGEETAVFHIARTDVDDDEDVPKFGFPGNENVESKSWTARKSGRKLFSIWGELWRTEIIEPGSTSERVLGENVPSNVEFIVDAAGHREAGETLKVGSRWLWFKSEVVSTVLRGRGAFLNWYTQDTGQVGLIPGSGVHFGINSLGLINVYAKDIALLPTWQQRIWAGFNVTPDGKVSTELLDSQMRAEPARSQAPEDFLRRAYGAANGEFESRTGGKPLFRPHQVTDDLFTRAHRFRALDRSGLFELAKDLARLTVESIDGSALNAIVAPPDKMKSGSIKHLEKALATINPKADAQKLTAVLVGINELRQADAHMPSKDLDDSILLAGIANQGMPVEEARQMLHELVDSLYGIARALADAPRSR
jgi:hypothetical protein